MLIFLSTLATAATLEPVVGGASPLGDTQRFVQRLAPTCGMLVPGEEAWESGACEVRFAPGGFELRIKGAPHRETPIEPKPAAIAAQRDRDLALVRDLGFNGFDMEFTETRVIAVDTRAKQPDGSIAASTDYAGTRTFVLRSLNDTLVPDHRLTVTRDAGGALLMVRGYWPQVPRTTMLSVSQSLASGEGDFVAEAHERVASETPVVVLDGDPAAPSSGMLVNRVVILPKDESAPYASGRVAYLLDGDLVDLSGD